MSFGKLRYATGNPPYVVNVKGINTLNTLHNASGLSTPEIDLPDSVMNSLTEGVIITTTDSTGRVNTIKRNLVDIKFLRKQHFGKTVSNPSVNNATEAIDETKAINGTFITTIPNIETFGITNDTTMDAWTAGSLGVYDYTAAPIGGIYTVPFDEVIRKSYLSGSSQDDRVAVRVMLCLTAQTNHLNGGGRTKFYSVSDTNLRADGSPLVIPSGGDYVPGSYSSPVFLDWVERFALGFFKRYYTALNAGLIMAVGYTNSNSGEAEYEPYERGYTPNQISNGDFHPAGMAIFRAKYSDYSAVDNNTIKNTDRNGTELARRWTHFLGEQLRKAEWRWNDYIIANVPQLQRQLWSMVDSGSFLDGLTPGRRTFNFYKRVHPCTMIVKCNDNPGSHEWHMFIADVLTSMARKYGCIPMMEPSPGDFNFNSGETLDMARTMRDNGVSISAFGNLAMSAFTANSIFNRPTPAYKNEYANNQVVRLNYPLSSIYNSGGSNGLKLAYEALKASKSVSRADIVVIDDVV